MGQPIIINKNIVLKKMGDKFLLPAFEKKEVTTSITIHKNYVMCRTISYNESSGCLEVKIQQDNVNEESFRTSTEVNSRDLLLVNIRHIQFIELRSSHIPIAKQTHFQNGIEIPKDFDELAAALTKLRQQHSNASLERSYELEQPSSEIVELTTSLPFEELDFLDGKVTFVYRIFKLNQTLTFEVANQFVRKEFDSIKNFFAGILGTPRCVFDLRVEVLNGNVINHSATSSHISQIN